MKEIWKTMKIPFNRYKISNTGRIINTENNYEFTLSNRNIGYIRVSLRGNNKNYNFLLHRLLAEYFLDDFSYDLVINHIDGNTFNNVLSNLECLSQKENNNKRINKNYGNKGRKIIQKDKNGNVIKIYDKIIDAPYDKGSILKCINGTYKYSYGCIWEYYEEEIEGEIWKNLYINNQNIKVSNMGRIRTKSGNITFGSKTRTGYKKITIDGKGYQIHRLVMMTFTNNKDYSLFVNHKDFNRENNKLENLEWVSNSENIKHYYENNTVNRNIRKTKIKRIDSDGYEKIYNSIKEASSDNNCSKGNICMVCKGKRKKCSGYKWEYVEYSLI
jgi:hypothetical protein